jgi:hypothetical protein
MSKQAEATDALAIETYDRAEAEAAERLSYPQVRAFAPSAFAQTNFPTRVREERALLRYCDIMREVENADDFYCERLYSEDEARLILETSDDIESLTGRLFGRSTQPFMTLFTPFDILRTVKLLAPANATVLEIGPGSGILGAYLIKSGYRYWATDNTQALYLWQNRLFSHVTPDTFSERVTDDRDAATVHLPWWLFAEMFKKPPSVDVIVCEAALGEMESFAVWYIAQLAMRMLKASQAGIFLYCQVGEQRISTLDHIEQIFALAGFQKQQCGSVTIHSVGPITLPEALPLIGDGLLKRPACSFLHVDEQKLLDSYAFFDFIGLGSALKASRARPYSQGLTSESANVLGDSNQPAGRVSVS